MRKSLPLPKGCGLIDRRPAVLLLIEGEPFGAAATALALEGVPVPHTLVRVPHQEPSADFLAGVDALAKTGPCDVVPKVVFLDLARPREPHLEVLRVIRGHPRTMLAPVVILAESATDAELRLVYEAGANSVLCKPSDEERRIEAIEMVATYWLYLNIPFRGDPL